MPADTDDEIATDAASPIHGVGAGVYVGGELAQVAIVVLNVVHASRTITLNLLGGLISKMGSGQSDALLGPYQDGAAGFSLGLCDWRSNGSYRKGSNGGEELHVEEDWNDVFGECGLEC